MEAHDLPQTAPPAAASPAAASTKAASPAAASPTAGRKLGLPLLIIATAQLMLVLDDTIVNVALPTIQRSLHLPTAHLNWVASFYALAFGGLLLAGGRAGDLYGRLRTFRIGLVVFAVASMAGGLAPDAAALLAARLIQGCGAALAAPGALSLLATTFPAGPARTRALGAYGAMAGLGSVVGLLLGGALTTYLSWRWVLFINVPLAIVVLAGSRTLVTGEREHGSIDIPGAATATLGIGSIIYALTSGSTNGWDAPVTLGCFAAGLVLVATFVALERTSQAPLVPIAVVRDRSRAGAYTVMLLVGAGMLAMFYLLTLYMQIVRGYSALHTGLAYLPFVAGLGIAAGGLGPRLLAKLPPRGVIGAGLFIFAGGLVWYGTHLTPTSDYFVAILPGLLAGGVGGGITFVAATAVSVHRVAPSDSGAAAGLLNTGIQVGAGLGLSGLASVASVVTRSRLPGHTLATALTDGYCAGLFAGAALFAIGAVVALAAINARIEAGEVPGH
jgi:EmrB/QacA subfamily drug resistance transporter